MVGQARALDWCLSGRMIAAEEARQGGLVTEVVPADQLLERAVAMGEQLSGQSAFAMTKIRQLILQNTNESDLNLVMRREGEALNATYASWEHKEAIEAFLTKRPADFQKQAPTATA
jgi:enoyl-CoA hydratase/carnithine racemase